MDERKAKYLRHADECRSLARLAPPDQRDALLDMAKTWENLAAARDERSSFDGEVDRTSDEERR